MADYIKMQQALDRKIAEEKAGIASLESQEQSFTKRLQDRRTQQQRILNGGAVDFASGLQSPNGIALDPQKLGNIFNSLVAANLEQTQPYEQDLKEVTAQNAKAQQSTSEFDMLAQMLGLQQEQEKINISAAGVGSNVPVNEATGEINWEALDPDALSDAEAEALVTDMYGQNIKLGATGPARGAQARLVLKKLKKGEDPDKYNLLIQDDKEKIDANNDMLETISRIEQMIGTTEAPNDKNLTGAGPSFLRGMREKVGWVSPESATLQTEVASLAGKAAFGDAGKALTQTERDIVEGKIPVISKDEKVLRAIVNKLKREAEKQSGAILRKATPGGSTTGAPTEKKDTLGIL